MYNAYMPFVSQMNPFGFMGAGPFIILLVIWSLVWKGLALWKAARAGSKPWFVALLILNTAGILDILYIYVFSKGNSNSVEHAHDHHDHSHHA